MDRKDLFIMLGGIFFLGITVFFVLDYIATVQHENVHRQIDTYFGCRNVSVELHMFDTSFTKCNDKNRTVSEQEWSLHAYNEVVTYNNSQISLTIFFCTLMIIVFVFNIFLFSNKD